ncbi:LysR substrate-binding domain-containing protein [Paraburkholderia fungorum]|uniref:LysR substrate-binding domain-containing protein n=1 Tax=Paraburkholderia fungorum TaxID=134537 RepID=UPI0038BA0500
MYSKLIFILGGFAAPDSNLPRRLARRMGFLPMSSIRFLKTFIAIAQHGSFAAAAEHVSVTQAAVGMQMRSLEQQLNIPLFDRQGRTAALSRNALALLPRIEQIVALYDGLSDAWEEDEMLVGSVTLGSVVSAMASLATQITALKTAHPRLDLRLVTGKSLELRARLNAREINAAVIVRLQESLPKPFDWRTLYEEPLVLVAHRETLTARAGSAAGLLRDRPFLSFDRSQRTGMLIELAVHRQGIAVNELVELDSLETIIELVRQDIGVAIVPLLRNATWQNDPLLRIIPLPVPSTPREVGILARTDVMRPYLMQALRERLIMPVARSTAVRAVDAFDTQPTPCPP